MSNSTFNTILDMIEDAGQALTRGMRRLTRALVTMTWPQLAVTCVALALALTIVPLALVLFMIFMAIKIIITSCIVRSRRQRPALSEPKDVE